VDRDPLILCLTSQYFYKTFGKMNQGNPAGRGKCKDEIFFVLNEVSGHEYISIA
jgi:hypothetical protein